MTTFSHRKDIHSTILISECQVEHTECPITYYRGKIMELCMCRCHSHAKPLIKEPDPIVGIAALKDIH
jgi:hypothetical protein